MDENVIMQPVLLVTSTLMLCECGKPAIILTLEDEDYSAWCQACFEQEEDEDE